MHDINASWLLGQILRTHLHAVMGVLILWALIGVLFGAILSAIAAYLLSRMGAFRLAWRHGTWLKIAAIVGMISACSLFGCVTGLIEGARRGVGIIVKESSFRSGVLLPLGAQCASGIAHMDCLLAQADQRRNAADRLTLSQTQEAFLGRFSEGKDELNVTTFLMRMDRAGAALVQEVVEEVMARLRANNLIKEGSLPDAILRRLLPGVIQSHIRQKAKNALDQAGLSRGVMQFFEKLPEAAARSGDPTTIRHDELAVYSVDHGVIPMIVYPARKIARGRQVDAVMLAMGALLLPVLLFWLGRYIERGRLSRTHRAWPKTGSA